MLARLVIAVLALPSIALAIELKPEFFETEIEGGFKVSEVALPDGPMNVVYAHPAGWRPTAGAAELSFAHPEFLHTTAAIRTGKATTLGEDEVKSRQEWLATLAPKDATEFTVEKAERSDLLVNSFPVLDLTASYTAFGRKYRVASYVIYASTGTIEFILISPTTTFEKTFEVFRRSIFTVRWEKPGVEINRGTFEK
jgi:hypothetical protein